MIRWRAWPRFLDGALEGIVLSFAAWTLFYLIALKTQWSLLPAAWPWVVLTAGLVVVGGLRAVRTDQPRVWSSEARRPVGGLVLLAVVVVATLALLLLRDHDLVWPLAVAAGAALVLQLVPWLGAREPDPVDDAPAEPDVPMGAHLVALAVSLGLGALTLFLVRPDADDVYYVNRATWVATHGTPTLRDTMFSSGEWESTYGGGLPTPSIEALQGALAHAIGVQAATFSYLVMAPAAAVLIGWTSWRLVRGWAARRALPAFLVAIVFLLASADTIVGNYSLGRIWQGKALAYAVLVPLVWWWLSRLARRMRTVDVILLAAAGVAFVGLSTTSALLAPVVAAAAVLAALVLRSRSLAIGAVAFAAAPVVNGLVQALAPITVGTTDDTTVMAAPVAFNIAMGATFALAALAVLALVLLPRTAPGPAGVLLGCGALATMVCFLPGVFQLAHAATGAGPVAWRLAIALPLWIAVGLLVTLPVPEPGGAALVVAVTLVPVLGGTWLWQPEDAQLTPRPAWKVSPEALANVRALEALDPPRGTWLLPPKEMEILAISRVDTHVVAPRDFYLMSLPKTEHDWHARVHLLSLVDGGELPSAGTVRESLATLDVTVACVPEDLWRARTRLRRAVGEPLVTVGDMRCAGVTPRS
ncbi:hypothetical protein GL325_12655 [Aeromicrobium sp. 636]|uniref:Uncharacterized protein n=1 Tax=Aeromicrobium senzhongii TaxID=2663859 RepID=A0A8I0EVI3_9ACTN|nr:DUF6077 domain-containing protein [Aeromicrobium sp. 636]MBC9227176.1 hypothetical protein [Aeromicrobium senzhongii]MCQ3999275.1 hypothetical protein [Aeromicrobium sp. 636]